MKKSLVLLFGLAALLLVGWYGYRALVEQRTGFPLPLLAQPEAEKNYPSPPMTGTAELIIVASTAILPCWRRDPKWQGWRSPLSRKANSASSAHMAWPTRKAASG
ncbi:hypothetical protein [Sphingopyxis sp. BSNA05]|uniref:hypothetical protein n=1 Tax=Sphingopyxis sp. BSNA05 TaxID=1236614 RepID=UPI001567A168|nr:hypothetical protein [Sphingopyxis sp. BSNA05]